MAEAIRVVVVDDQPLFASGIAMLIDAQEDMTCVATASDGADAIDLVGRERPDVVLMDLRMPGLNGIEATHRILAEHETDSGPRIIALTTLRQDVVVVKALAAGASAFLTKDATPDQVLGTIRTAHERATVPDIEMALALVADLSPTAEPQRAVETLDALSPREREVFLLVARGLTNAEIAKSAYVSTATVKTHIAAILRKLDLRSRVQVVVFAHQNGLVTA